MDWNGKKILITGISGFIGSNLGRELLKRGAKIHSIDNFSYINSKTAKEKLNFLERVVMTEGDVSKKETWNLIPRDIEYVFHFAGPSSITLFKKDPEKCYLETVLGFWNALEFSKNNGVKKVVWPSSGSNYAGNEMPHKESIGVRPRNLYAAAKISCEGLASSYSDFVNSIGLRIFGGYGPGEEWKRDFGSVLYLFIRDYMRGKSPEIWGDGSQTRDFVYIDDVVKSIIKAAEIDYTGVVNVGTGKSISFRDALNTIKKSLNAEIDPIFIPKEKNYVENLEADTTLMKNLFGIEPIKPEEGIKKFIDYLRASS
jgi:UDP-glucose 4-epimerase